MSRRTRLAHLTLSELSRCAEVAAARIGSDVVEELAQRIELLAGGAQIAAFEEHRVRFTNKTTDKEWADAIHR